jgi:hypothetical protein
MTTLLEKIHLNMLARLNAVILVGLVCTGLAASMLGASVYDIGRWFSLW